MVGITAAWRLGNHAGETVNPVLVGIETIAHAALFISLFVWTLRPERGHVSMLALGMVVVLLCVAAGGASRSLASQTTVALIVCLAFTLASQIILGVARGTGGAVFFRDQSGHGNSTWMGPLVSMLTLSILMMATSVLANATNLVLPNLQNSLQEQLQESLESVVDDSRFGGTRYVRGSRLGTLRAHMLGAPQEIALRITADVAPGYLRGHAFDSYRGRRWNSVGNTRFDPRDPMVVFNDRSVTPSGAGTVKLQDPNAQPLRRFPLVQSPSERTINLEIQNDPLKGQMVFLPLTTQWLEARSRELVVTSHGIIQFGVDVSEPYVAGVGPSALREELTPARRNVLVLVPPSVSAETQRLADEVCGSLPTAETKAAAISRFFQTKFQYSMNRTKSPAGVDPIVHLLRTRHAAHCEYFASATVLLLRSAGVPARYVTGYVADEFYDEDSVWVARNRDAHAWAEAYDGATGQWFPVESTPGRSYQTVDLSLESQQSDSALNVLGAVDNDGSDTLLGAVVGWLISLRVTESVFFFFRIIQLPLFCVLVFLLWTKYLRPAHGEANSIDQQSRKMLRTVDRRARRHALVRQPGETLYQFAERIETRRADTAAPLGKEARNLLAEVSSWYRAYADARYQGQLPVPFG
jgi:transglutaminase-like putative cysteine protease